MRNVTIDNVTDIVLASMGRHGEQTPRQQEVMASLVKHLHAFCKDVKLQHSEFLYACDYLGRAGALCSDKRQEFILLGDILGVEVLVDMLTRPVRDGESESTVLGPFYRENPPVLPNGASCVLKDFEGQETVLVEGVIRDTDGNPIEGVLVDIWEDAPNGLYENHDPEQPDYNLRGRYMTDAEGRYAFRALRPAPYPIPEDETAGELIHAMGHHPMRPGHIHFLLEKEGFGTLVSQVFDSESDYIDNDSVFAVKESLIARFEKAAPEHGTDLHVTFDFVLAPAAAAETLAAE
ncbi:dioxygenase [Rhodovulum sp. DZ06]|uniref:dioxygenase family protein n=1 Tax=Rhodovulum sp. DZ06 TaxID=3425126 RepID=UPI003D333CF0